MTCDNRRMRTLVVVALLLVGCGTPNASKTGSGIDGATDAGAVHTAPWCPTPDEAEAAGTGLNQAGTVVSHMDLSTNPAACEGDGPFGQGLQPGQSWRFSTIYADGSINVPVGTGFVPCDDGGGGCLTSISFTPTDTSCTYVWEFKYCANTDVGLCCEMITAQIVNPLSPPTGSEG